MTASSPDLRDFSGLLVLVGAGKMGGALLEGWLHAGLPPANVAVIEPNPSPEIAALAQAGVRLNPNLAALPPAAAIVIAVKPQTASEAMPVIAPMIDAATVVVSIMAGRTLHFLAGALRNGRTFVRAMPNMPAAIGRGITVAVAAPGVSATERATADALLRATGSVEWVEDEGLMDAVTAVSGSGPAYVFLLAEELARAGVAAGLPEELATKLARETVAGSGELLHRSELAAATLRQNVTSPGGTTAAALEVLMGNGGMQGLMTRAVAAATARSKELAK
jgi:pyrroline-5-carboxylate reductase